MTAEEKRTDAGLWLLHAAASLGAAGVVVAAFAHLVLESSERQTALVRLLARVDPWAHRAVLAALVAGVAGSLAGALGEGGARARGWALAAGTCFAAVAGLVATRVDTRSLVALRADAPLSLAAVAASALGWAFCALHVAALERVRSRPEEAGSARRLAAHVGVAGAWLVGVLALAARFREAEQAQGDLDGPGVTLVVAGAGLAALLFACAAWMLRRLAEAREARAVRPGPHAG